MKTANYGDTKSESETIADGKNQNTKLNDSSATNMTAKTPKKRTYSRNGCITCKRRRAKCDENKPYCHNCLSTNRECIYRKVLKFKDTRSYTIAKNTNGSGSTLLNFRKIHDNIKNDNFLLHANQNSGKYRETELSKTDGSLTLVDPFLDKLPQVVQNAQTPPIPSIDDVQRSFISQSALPNSGNLDSQSMVNLGGEFPNNLANIPVTASDNIDQLDLENSLFNGASNLITDLNGLINSFQMDFSDFDFAVSTTPPGNLDQFTEEHQQQLKQNQSLPNEINVTKGQSVNADTNFSQSLLNIKFEGISPTNYSVASSNSMSSPQNMQVNYSNATSACMNRGNSSISKDLPKSGLSHENKGSNVVSQCENFSESDDDGDSSDDNQAQSNKNYIRTLTRSLVDYGTPKESAKSSDSPVTSNNISSRNNNKLLKITSKAFPAPSKDILYPFDYIEMFNKTFTKEDLKLMADFFNWNLDSSHVKYLKVFVTNILPNIIPFTTNYTNNAYIKVFLQQAKNSPHLLFAILAISARYEVYQMEQQGDLPNREEKLQYHRTFRTYYLSSCLKSLESVLHSKQNTLNNIESLLLTIQVLASDFSGHKGLQWKTHLHGAKDLLVKYCRYRPLSLELTIVWLWFYSMEVLAALTSQNGGTIHNSNELDEFLPVLCPKVPQNLLDLKKGYEDSNGSNLIEPGKLSSALKRFGISIEGTLGDNSTSSFNMYLGYDETMLEVFNALVYAIECLRGKREQSTNSRFAMYEKKILESSGKTLSSTFLLSLFGQLNKARSFKYINNEPPYMIPLGSKVHPADLLQKVFIDGKSEEEILKNVVISAYIHPTQNKSTRKKLDEHHQVDGIVTPQLNVDSNREPASSVFEKFGNIYESDILEVREELYFSWIDLSQQLYVDAAFLKLLTLQGGMQSSGLSIKSSLIQDIVQRMIMGLYGLVRLKENIADDINDQNDDIKSPKLLDLERRYYHQDTDVNGLDNDKKKDTDDEWEEFHFDKYVNYQFDNRLVMVQWPLYVCGLCCTEAKHKAIIECCFSGLIGLGIGSGEISLKKLRRVWKLQKLNRFDYDNYNLFGKGYSDTEEDDYVPFM